MVEKWCSCKHRDAALCHAIQPSLIHDRHGCVCACHGAESRPASVVHEEMSRALQGRATVRRDGGELDYMPSYFTAIGGGSEVLIEYDPGEGFGVTLVGWAEDESRQYRIPSLVARVQHLLEGGV